MTNAHVLAGRLADLLRREQAEMATFLVALADFDRRRAWLELGYSSLFYFLHRELGLSKGAAHYRKTAAELIQRYPEIVEPLRDGRLCITSVVHVAKVLTSENRHEMLPKFFRRSKREAKAMAAALQPATAAPHRDVVTAVRPPSAARVTMSAAPPARGNDPSVGCTEVLVQPVEPTAAPPRMAAPSAMLTTAAVQPVEPASLPPEHSGDPIGTEATPGTYAKGPHRDAAEPVTAELSRLHVTVSRRFLEKLEAARAALSHAHPSASMETILESGLDLVLQRHATRRGLVKNPRPDSGASKSHGVAAAVKRKVWKRDGGGCQWPLEAGGTCGSRLRLEFDHIIPRAMGGPSTPENLRLLCRFHNDLAARGAFGAQWMNQFTRAPGIQRAPGPPD